MEDKKKILLLGGTGAMGVYLVPELLKKGYEVYVTSRRERQSDCAGLFYITGNAKDESFIRQELSNHYDAVVDFMIYKTEEFRSRCQLMLESTKHYLFVSSYRVYGDNHGQPIREDSPRLLDTVTDQEYLATDEYALTKARQENILRLADASNWTIVRPAITYSRERFQLGTMEAADFVRRALAGKTVIFPKQMLCKEATLSWAGDVAKLISALVLNGQAMGEAYTVSTAEHHAWQTILDYYKELLNMKVKIVDLKVYQSIMGGPYQIRYDRMLDRVVDNSKILEISGMKQTDFIPLKEGLRMELENFKKDPVYSAVNKKRDQMMDEAVSASGLMLLCKKILRKVKQLLHK